MNPTPAVATLGAIVLLGCAVPRAHAQPAVRLESSERATGSITGRVFNPATGEYVRNAEVAIPGSNLSAYSDADGSYALLGVPAGAVTVRVTYTGYEAATAQLSVVAGQAASHDFNLTPLLSGPGVRGRGDLGAVVKLQEFVVSSEREGNAKAIMEQRAALNVKNVFSADNFGDITNGNVGEFIKYVPGVVIDYSQSDARSVRIGGLDPRYAGVSVDGMRLASAASAGFGADSRQFEFEQANISSIDAIEVNKTLTARMDADSPAGAINLRTRSAFDRKGREFIVHLTASANEYHLTLGRVASPTNALRRLVFPGLSLGYSEVFGGRLGVQLNAGSSTIYGEQQQITNAYDFSNPARGPVITGLTFKDAPKIIERASLGANLDYKFSPRLTGSLRIAGSHLSDEFNARQLIFTANLAQIDPTSSLTRVIANPTNNANTRLDTSGNHRNKRNDTITYSGRLEWQHGGLNLTAGGGYSRSRTHYEDLRRGFFQSISLRLTRMGWMAERPDTNSLEWHVTQRSGRPWGDIANWGRDDANANNVASTARSGQSQVFTGFLDGRQALTLAGLPVQLLAGVKSRLTTFANTWGGTQRWTFVGPRGSQTDPTTVMIDEDRHHYNPRQGGNVPALNFPYPDSNAMAALFQAQPGQFVPDTIGNFTSAFTAPRSVQEQVDAGYVEGSTRWRDWRFNLGVRRERTRTIGRTFDILPAAAVRAAGYTPGTIPYVIYQYRNGERPSSYGGYDHTFFSGGVKYHLARNLVLQAAASQSIGRPGYNSIAGVIAVNEAAQRVTLPNPDLKPETSDKYFVSAQYYLEPAGTLSLSGYTLIVENMGTLNESISAAEAGYADDPEYAGFTFVRAANAAGRRRIKGLDLEYSQQLVFLPGWLRGFSVFGSLSRSVPDQQIIDLVAKSANGGLRYGNSRFNLQARFTWTAARITSITAARTQWERERLMFDLSGGLRFNRTYELTLSCRNVLNQALETYANEPGTRVFKDNFGAVWTVGLRGRF